MAFSTLRLLQKAAVRRTAIARLGLVRFQSGISPTESGIDVSGGRLTPQSPSIVQPVTGGTRGSVSSGAGREGATRDVPSAARAGTYYSKPKADRRQAGLAEACPPEGCVPEPLSAREDLRAAGRLENIAEANSRATPEALGLAPGLDVPVGLGVVLGKEGEMGLDPMRDRQVGSAKRTGRHELQEGGSGDLRIIAEVNRRAAAEVIGEGGSAELHVEGSSAVFAGEFPADPRHKANVPRSPYSPTSAPGGRRESD